MKTIDFFERVKRLFHETHAMKKYKAIASRPLAVFVFIFMLPFYLMFLMGIGLLFIFTIIYNVCQSPIKYLHSILREEGQVVRHGTQIVVYLVSWPIVFFAYLFICFAVLFINIYYVTTALFGYIWTLCGYKFHVDIYEEDISIPDADFIDNARPTAFVIVCSAILLIFLIVLFVIMANNGGYYSYLRTSKIMCDLFSCFGAYSLFTIIYIPIAFHKNN